MSVLQHRPRLVSGVKGCGLGRPGLLRMYQNNCYFGLRDLTRVSCWSSCFSGVSLDFFRLCVTRSHQQRLSAHFCGIGRVGADDQIR